MSVCQRGMGKEESGGLGEKTRRGKGDCSRAAPLSLGCLPKTSVKRYCVNGLVKYYEQHRKNPKQGTAGGSRFPMQTGLNRGLLQGIDTACHDDAAA